jgi:hypothetical protein
MTDPVALSEALLSTMRLAAQKSIELREAFITPRAILLALMDDPDLGIAIRAVVNLDRVMAAETDGNFGVSRVAEDDAAGNEEPALARYDTLAFKTPDGRSSVWLSRDAYDVFAEGAQRTETEYFPRHLALGLAAQSVLAPGVLTAIRVEPGVFADAIYKL